MSEVIVAHGKHGNMIYPASTQKEKNESALKLLRFNHEEMEFYYEEDEVYTVNDILKSEDGIRAWEFLRERIDYEYEYVALEPLL